MKYYVSAALALFLAVSAVGQNANPDPPSSLITIKPSIGGSLTNFRFSEYQVKSRPGYQLGGSVLVGNKLYGEAGLFYMRKSSTFEGAYTNANMESDNMHLKLGGLYIPVDIGINVLGDERSFFSVHALAGASGFFLTDAYPGPKSFYQSATYGVFAGAGVNVGLFFAEAKYEWSETNSQQTVPAIGIGKARSLFLNVGLRFRL